MILLYLATTAAYQIEIHNGRSHTPHYGSSWSNSINMGLKPFKWLHVPSCTYWSIKV